MKQKVTGFHQDSENHWVAELSCGHAQHVRHDPPWQERPWVITQEGRESRLGLELQCKRCDEAVNVISKAVVEVCRETLRQAYETAGLSGLCQEGRWELALDSLNSVDSQKICEFLSKSV